MSEQPTWQDLLDLVTQLNESNYETASVSFGNISVHLSNSDTPAASAVPTSPAVPVAPATATHSPATAQPAAAAAAHPAGHETIDAPMIGVFYRRPAPGAEMFVQPGDRVEADTTIGIIEIMKLMNPIVAGKAGVLGDFLVQDAQAVEFGTPLVSIDTNA
jgi:acetyl-CoA carboxylase biotin carboxyl carrier protein